MFRPHDFEVADLGRVLARRRAIILAFLVTFVALAVVLNVVTRPVFRTAARLVIQPPQNRSPVSNLPVETPSPVTEHLSLLTTAERIMSRDVLARVALDLEGRGIGMAERVQATTTSEPPPATASIGPSLVEEDPQLVADVAWLAKNVSVRPLRDTRLVDVYAEHSSAQHAAEIANAVAREFIRSRAEARRGADQERLRALRAQIEDVRKSITEQEQALYDTRRSSLVVASEKSRQLAESGHELSSSAIKTGAELRVVERQLELIRRFRRAQNPDWSNPPIQTNAMDLLYRDLQRAETALQDLRRQYRDQSPEVVAAEAQLGALRDAMRRELQKSASDLEAQRDLLLARRDEVESARTRTERQLEALSDSTRKYSALEGDIKTKKEMLLLLMQRAQEQNVAQTILPASEELVQTAAVPLERVRPRKALNVALGVALGLVFGSGAAFGLESLRRTIRTPQDVMHEIRLPVLGMIPRRQ